MTCQNSLILGEAQKAFSEYFSLSTWHHQNKLSFPWGESTTLDARLTEPRDRRTRKKHRKRANRQRNRWEDADRS